MNDQIKVQNKQVFVYGNPDADLWIVQPIEEGYVNHIDLEIEKINNLTENPDFFFIAIMISNWNHELSPWPAAPVFGKDGFADEAPDTLSFIMDSLIPSLKNKYKSINQTPSRFARQLIDEKYYIIAGYSLAGLFALWSVFHTEFFSGAAAVSPSVWFPGFVEFTEKRELKTKNIYLSLGDKEAQTRNPLMRTVAKCLNEEYQIITEKNANCILEWNQGNHFTDIELRTAKGIAWVMKALSKENLTPEG